MPINDIIDGLFNNIELNGQIRSRYLRVRFFYIGYIFIFNGCLRVLLSMCHSFFRGCILRIFFMCAQKQVFWVYARRIIALVANAKPFWNCPVVDFIRMPVRQRLPSGSHIFELAIPKLALMSYPEPTTISFFDKIKKPFFLILSFFGWLRTSGTRFRAIFSFSHIDRGFTGHKVFAAFFTNAWDACIFSHVTHYNGQRVLTQGIF